MRFTTLLLLSLFLLGLSGCNKTRSENESVAAPQTQAKGYDARARVAEARVAETSSLTKNESGPQENVSLNQADAANRASQAMERKILRNANLTVEVTSPTESQRKIASIAESHQGFVVTSESTQRTTEDKTRPEITVNLVVRVPA